MKPLALVINSSLDQTSSIINILTNQGIDVITAHNGLEGLQMLHGSTPDIIFCNYDLPLIQGTEVIKTAKKIKRLKDIPFVFTAESPTLDAMVVADSLHADAFIYQPVAACNLIYTIKKHIHPQLQEIA